MKLTDFEILSISWKQGIKQVSSEKEAVRSEQPNIYHYDKKCFIIIHSLMVELLMGVFSTTY